MTAKTVPAQVGSPPMDVLAAIPITVAGDLVCVVRQHNVNRELYGTVRAWQGGTGTWHAESGNYDFYTVRGAVVDMIIRAGLGNVEG